ncbi:hypothetical protein [Bdellovibrio bacteriovorus]|uniref:hypothetical protein n=1 Tax=Bdellovibrio bacteriovorus TaxID=959 RepID=UPI003AA842A9
MKKILFFVLLISFSFEAHAASKMFPKQAAQAPVTQPKPVPEKTEEPPVVTPTPGVPALPKLAWDGAHPQSDVWTEFLLSELEATGKDMLNAKPADRATFCKKYDQLDQQGRKLFYAQFISKLAQFESDYIPSKVYVECSSKPTTYGKSGRFFASKGKWCIPGHAKDGGVAISRGLTQLSLESAQGYKCPLTEPSELHDPKKNLSCAVRIMNRFIPAPRQYEGATRGHNRIAQKVDGVWKGAAAYWAPLRDSSEYNRESLAAIVKYTSNLSICK